MSRPSPIKLHRPTGKGRRSDLSGLTSAPQSGQVATAALTCAPHDGQVCCESMRLLSFVTNSSRSTRPRFQCGGEVVVECRKCAHRLRLQTEGRGELYAVVPSGVSPAAPTAAKLASNPFSPSTSQGWYDLPGGAGIRPHDPSGR